MLHALLQPIRNGLEPLSAALHLPEALRHKICIGIDLLGGSRILPCNLRKLGNGLNNLLPGAIQVTYALLNSLHVL